MVIPSKRWAVGAANAYNEISINLHMLKHVFTQTTLNVKRLLQLLRCIHDEFLKFVALYEKHNDS